MTRDEWRAGTSLASIFALRMLGLFLLLPVFALHARTLPGGDNLTLVGLALGAYGLTQAVLQIPFGVASDRVGRKKVIVAGLLLFIAGSLVGAVAEDVVTLVVARCLQGAGAISAAVTALAADLTREQHRTKVMAMIGSTIGLVFAGSLVLAPLLYNGIGMDGMFALIAALGLAALLVVWRLVPAPPLLLTAVRRASLGEVARDGQLLRLNFGVFALHLIQMAMWVAVPAALLNAGGLPLASHWQVYLPVVLVSFALMVPAIIQAERKGRMKQVFLSAIGLLLAAQLGFMLGYESMAVVIAMLLVFFVAFNIMEASQPSLVSRLAPPEAKGAALGIYNTVQSLGAFLGGTLGGVFGQHFGAVGVFGLCAAVALIWLLVALGMKAPPVLASREVPIDAGVDLEGLRQKLSSLPGVREAIVVPERRVAYIKLYKERCDEQRLQEILEGRA